MKRVTIRQYELIAEDHNRHNEGDNCTWKDIIYDEVLCGNNIKADFDRMSKKELLTVIDWAASSIFTGPYDRTYHSIYKVAMTSLEGRL